MSHEIQIKLPETEREQQLWREVDIANKTIARYQQRLLDIKKVAEGPASNRKFMQIAGPARQIINLCNMSV